MGICAICEKKVSVLFKAIIGNSVLEVCNDCLKFGKKIGVDEVDKIIKHTPLIRHIDTVKEKEIKKKTNTSNLTEISSKPLNAVEVPVIKIKTTKDLQTKETGIRLLDQPKRTIFVGSKSSNKYHYFKCICAKKITPQNSVYFKTIEEVNKSGYIPCGFCKPSERLIRE